MTTYWRRSSPELYILHSVTFASARQLRPSLRPHSHVRRQIHFRRQIRDDLLVQCPGGRRFGELLDAAPRLMPPTHPRFAHLGSVAFNHDRPRHSKPLRNEPEGRYQHDLQQFNDEVGTIGRAGVSCMPLPETPSAIYRPARAIRVSYFYFCHARCFFATSIFFTARRQPGCRRCFSCATSVGVVAPVNSGRLAYRSQQPLPVRNA